MDDQIPQYQKIEVPCQGRIVDGNDEELFTYTLEAVGDPEVLMTVGDLGQLRQPSN